MRFHIGFSKRIKLSTLLKFCAIFIGIFGLNSCVVHADSFTTLQNWSWCPFNSDYFDNSSCTVKGANDITSSNINGFTNVLKPFTSTVQSMGKSGAEKHVEYFKWGGTSDCNTGSTISFDIDIIMNDVQEIFPNNALDPNSWSGASPMLRGVFYNHYYSWLSYFNGDYSPNNEGVQVAKNDYQKNYHFCTFVSYGSNKSLKFRCSIDSGPTGYFVRIPLSNADGTNASFIRNYATNTNLPAIVTGIKVNVLNDPCKQYGTDQSSVVGAITDQTNDIMEGLQDIIDNNNSNTNSINNHIDGVAEGIEGLNDSIDGVAEGIEGLNNSIMSNALPTANINTSWMTYPTKIENIIYMPVSILRTIKGSIDNATCTSPSIDFSSIMEEWGNSPGGLQNGYVLRFPCMRDKIPQLIGNDFYTLIDYLLCAVLVYNFLIHLYKKFDSAISGSDHLIDDYYLQDTNMVGANLNYMSKRGGIDYD